MAAVVATGETDVRQNVATMSESGSDFRLYYANALDVLAAVLAEEMRKPVPGVSPLTPDTVLIPQAAMRRWLQATLAQRHGVVANVEFLAPGEFVSRALDANVPGQGDDLDTAALHWQLYAALNDPVLLARPALAPIAAYLGTDARGSLRDTGDDPLKAWTLAGELAAVFEKYQAWRRDWLLRWEAGAEPDDPQAILWRAVASGRSYRARRIQHYLDRFEGDGKPLPQGLPRRLFAFATLNVSPDVLRVIATQSRVGTTHFFMPTPAEKYWGDLQALGRRLRDGEPDPLADSSGDSRLLQAWGAAGRDFVAVLGAHEIVRPSGEILAHADPRPDTTTGSEDAAVDVPDSLLRRLQADVFHRRPPPPEAPTAADARTRLAQVDEDDPSLQIHACHTRLRELQVLHDRLRGLFDDPRFDPPLQARDIAVLAPDIDQYTPYLDAVFGGGDSERIPYAVADTSPLASEPLAEVFVHLLGLPVSRFGLSEILDLLGSTPIATAAGLDAPALDRLRTWLHAAGARWGLDVNHRVSHLAPADDVCTWQFALDRLLLGHATGADEDIVAEDGRRVAPLPEQEGSALDALDTLIRLLRVLARHQQTLAQALTPMQWRERLLGLLLALFPVAPTDAGTQRALERLRKLIDTFAQQAGKAGFDGTVPVDVVRHHFASELAEADTRAPLLTGGVSFGRMVPMRLLPFRVICVLGMNDGDYPRRDPAAGLNRLTAAIAAGEREPGDRSLREDDRFLFLQLFTAAQDVFHLSYLGADPRDGSVREPSVLVSELLDEAARQHADPKAAAKQLVLRHPLQPFAPAAFGGRDVGDAGNGDRRRYSYRRQWHPAAGALSTPRQALPPWFGGDPLPPVDGDGSALTSVSLDELYRFLTRPAEQFLRQRLGIRIDEIAEIASDQEPLLAPSHGLEKHALQQVMFDALLLGEDDARIHAALRARALLPTGAIGLRNVQALRQQLGPYAQAFAQWRGDAVAESPLLEVMVDGVRLHGRLREVYAHGIARRRLGAPSGNSVIRHGLDWLLASAAGLEQPLVEFHDGGDAGVGPHPRDPIGAEQARVALKHLLALRARGLREPLPFAPYAGLALYDADDGYKGLQEAQKKWHGSERSFAEGGADAPRLALRGRDPFADDRSQRAFADLSFAVFAAVTAGQVAEPLDDHTWRPMAQSFEVEDSE